MATLAQMLGMQSKPKSKPQKPEPQKPKPKPKPPGKWRPAYLGGKVQTDKVKPPKGGKFLGARPALIPNINPNRIGAEASREGARSLTALTDAYRPLFDTLAGQQRGQIDALAGRLDNQYTADARTAIGGSLTDAQRMTGLGRSLANQAAFGFRTSGPTSIEQELYRQGQSELALGRSLSPEQLREATQSARQAFAARGLGTSMGAAGAELLNRDRYATERQAQRRQFAAGANQMREENVMARRDAAGRLGALGGGLMESAGTMRQRGGAMMADIDPYARALTPGMALGQSAQQFGLNTAGTQFGRGMELFGGASTFNVNRMDNLRTNWMDNAAAVMGANRQASATRAAANAAKPSTFETIVGGISNIFRSDKRLKTDIKPLGQASGLLGLTAYEFRYKGDKKKRRGFMAQDVQKVLPEAVEEFDDNGKKRLAINPMVIGAALAQELMTAKAA